MSGLKDNHTSNNKSSSSSITNEEESTLLKSSGYHSASDSKTSSINSSKEDRDEKKPPKDTKKKIASKGKVISSRYRQAALSATSRMRNSSSNLQQTISQGDVTHSGSDIRCNSPLRNAARSGLSASCMEVQRGGSYAKKGNMAKDKRTACLHSPNMHSTAVNATLLDSTRGFAKTFSTSVVKAPPKRTALAYMPDISAIQPFTATGNVQMLSESSIPHQDDSDDEYCDLTQVDLDLEYLRYLTWAYVDTSSEEAFQYQCSDAEKQISFLMQIIKEKQETIMQHKRQLMLSKVHEQVAAQHRQLVDELTKFAEVAPQCQKAVEEIGLSLQPKINRIKLKNIYVPENEENYKEQIKDALLDTNEILKNIDANITPRQNYLQSCNETASYLKNKMEAISICKKNASKVAACAIQEASLRLTLKDAKKTE